MPEPNIPDPQLTREEGEGKSSGVERLSRGELERLIRLCEMNLRHTDQGMEATERQRDPLADKLQAILDRSDFEGPGLTEIEEAIWDEYSEETGVTLDESVGEGYPQWLIGAALTVHDLLPAPTQQSVPEHSGVEKVVEQAVRAIDSTLKYLQESGLMEEGGGLPLYEATKPLAEARANLAAIQPFLGQAEEQDCDDICTCGHLRHEHQTDPADDFSTLGCAQACDCQRFTKSAAHALADLGLAQPEGDVDEDVAERIARAFHGVYETLAPEFGYESRPESRVPWAEVPEKNRALMIGTVRRLMLTGVIAASPQPENSGGEAPGNDGESARWASYELLQERDAAEAAIQAAIAEFEQRAAGCQELGTDPAGFEFAVSYLKAKLEALLGVLPQRPAVPEVPENSGGVEEGKRDRPNDQGANDVQPRVRSRSTGGRDDGHSGGRGRADQASTRREGGPEDGKQAGGEVAGPSAQQVDGRPPCDGCQVSTCPNWPDCQPAMGEGWQDSHHGAPEPDYDRP